MTLAPKLIFLAAAYILLSPWSASAVTEYKDIELRFTTSLKDLKSSLSIETESKSEDLEIPLKKLRVRARNFDRDERIDPVQIYVHRDEDKLIELVKKTAKRGRAKEVLEFYRKKLSEAKPTKKRVLVDLDLSILKFMRLKAIAHEMSRGHHNVKVLAEKLNDNPRQRREFLSQMKLFLSTRERIRIVRKLKKDEDLIVHDDLLPRFARKMAKRFIVFRGPNCFHAALAFHGQSLTRSSSINVKREKGYHRAMINYDELWRAINRHFYEVDPKKSELKYGDMLVFFNIPKENPSQVNFRWIRHTATYLFDEYTFSKGSKSPNTPYTVKTLNEEWGTWERYTKNLGVRVFRRAHGRKIKSTPEDLTDWIF
ncbi:hypothetical protein [Pseudobacteriovorax antillogorgiicola]|uniref:Uncharacterized protein n=1 Tax=Pseudobacteriovorax antillogorgiicola TaxID=1513793 RepID=A0A1Y6C7J5_9BACT|nr:hypothetical protein [Pseudobacteriovorax antillogorgiicola]TCS49460.1 hypothetical protein EDD56_115142 [Pseudobacteriovorax antillogorgiicola]SMF46373.1 hypothetical protein SAMN06296036_11443 [Pseudobacteriovorax antillogorgiicola]